MIAINISIVLLYFIVLIGWIIFALKSEEIKLYLILIKL